DYCYGRADLPEPKPSGAAFDPLLRASGLTADRVMYVGDAPSDYAAATAAGVGFVGVASGPHPSGTDSQMTMPGITDILNLLSQGPFASCHR
ncbi:MAG: HAD hydrolase-like protein, partial [Paracoccaceae bacterium]